MPVGLGIRIVNTLMSPHALYAQMRVTHGERELILCFHRWRARMTGVYLRC